MPSMDTELSTAVKETIQECIPEYDNENFKELGLTPQEILFTYLNVRYNDPVQSYKEAFGADHKTALAKAKKLEQSAKIKEATAMLYDEIWESAIHALPTMLLSELERVRNLNVASFMAGDRFKNPDELTEAQQMMLEGIQFQINNKTGETLIVYQFPSKSAIYSKYLDLIKLYKESTKDKEQTNTDREAADMVKSIFSQVGKNEEG